MGGSALPALVNLLTEEIVLKLLNENKAAGIELNDKRHPIKQFEKWKHQEGLRGVAGSKTVPLIGAVVVRINMLEVGKQDGPEVVCRFKICAAGTTDWVGWILGARAIDCPAYGGLGFVPGDGAHHMTTLGILMERTERPGAAKPDQCYAIRLGSLDSEDEEEDYVAQVGATMSTRCSVPIGYPVLYEGDPITLQKGEGAWVPVVVPDIAKSGGSGALCVCFPVLTVRWMQFLELGTLASNKV